MAEIVGTDQNFKSEVLEEQQVPVLVDFWATWCTPCKIQGPIIDELSKEMGDKVKFVKMEVDENPTVPGQYNVLSIPTLAIFKHGQMVWQGIGVHQKQALQSELAKHTG